RGDCSEDDHHCGHQNAAHKTPKVLEKVDASTRRDRFTQQHSGEQKPRDRQEYVDTARNAALTKQVKDHNPEDRQAPHTVQFRAKTALRHTSSYDGIQVPALSVQAHASIS